MPQRIVIHGLPYFCGKLSAILKDPAWDVRYCTDHTPVALAGLLADLHRCDLAFTWGGRISMGKFLWAARCLRKEKIVILWCGSDVLYAQKDIAAGKMDTWAASQIHWAVSPVLAEEVRALGLTCDYVQASFVQPVQSPAPLPEKFSVLVYVPSREKAELYGLDHILEVAETLRQVEFVLVGWESESLEGPANLKVHNRVGELGPFVDRASVVWRPVRHDAGISFMVLEALAKGRHVLYSYPFSACIQVTSASQVREQLQRLLDRHQSRTLNLNEAGIRLIAQDYSPERVRANLFQKWGEIISAREKQALGSEHPSAEKRTSVTGRAQL
ncbi:MAG TPA: hypothetical protein VFN26_13705 [Candidatus Acidoferrum sp.]|nr:hypothetical protein [Candidatus Acidoferrum sp.]